MDNERYLANRLRTHNEFESLCGRCGECCGSTDGDPCVNLVKDASGRYCCRIYEDRFGPQETKNGAVFTCVGIRDMIRHGYLRESCAYNRLMNGNPLRII